MQVTDALRSLLRLTVALALVVSVLVSFAAPLVVQAATASPPVRTNIPLHAEFTPNDPLFKLQWGLNAIDAPTAWNVGLGSHNIVVAVVDTGVWYTDTDLAPNMWNNTDGSHGWNFILNNNDPMDSDAASNTYHGTGVAGVIGAVINNNDYIAGVANTGLMALEALGPNGEGTSYNTSLAIRWAADHGARVINLSLGTNTTLVGPTDIQLAIDYAWSKGALIVAAAGNSGSSTLDYPASLPNVVSVAAVTQSLARAPFSNYGTGLSMGAPGYQILTLCPSSCGGTHLLDGTSLAAPFVSGVAALVLADDPSLTNVELWNVLNRTAVPQGTAGYNTGYGWGVVNAWNAINALNKPFISVNSFPKSVSKGSAFAIDWSIIGPAGLPVTDTHVVYGPDAGSLNSSTPIQTGTTRQAYSATDVVMPQAGSGLSFKIVAAVNGTQYESPVQTVIASNLPNFLFVLYQFLASNLLYLALFILALAAVVAFVPQRRARARRTAMYRQQTVLPPTSRYSAPPPGPPPGPPSPVYPQTVQSPAAASQPPPVEFVRPSAPPPPAPARPAPPAAMAAKKRCSNCGTLVNADNMFCFYCGSPLR
ncbi:MAG TPA: S8 family serine peptidase [Thermoplasmata archaeon]|nr:S8 family serine peptidase [Thermoplasmata archaeon]